MNPEDFRKIVDGAMAGCRALLEAEQPGSGAREFDIRALRDYCESALIIAHVLGPDAESRTYAEEVIRAYRAATRASA